MLPITYLHEKINWKEIGKDTAQTAAFLGTGAAMGALTGDQIQRHRTPSPPREDTGRLFKVVPKEPMTKADRIKGGRLAGAAIGSKLGFVGAMGKMGYDMHKDAQKQQKPATA